MQRLNNFVLSAAVAGSLISDIIASAEQTIKLNRFTQRNQPKFILHEQQNILNTNLQHLLEKPAASSSTFDVQPKRIPEDNLMNAGIQDRSVSLQQSKKKASVKIQPERFTKRSISKTENEPKQGRPKKKQTFPSRLEVLLQQNQDKEQRDSYVEALRRLKIEEEDRLARAGKNFKRPKPHLIMGKGEQIVCDYQGNFNKRKDNPFRGFDNVSLQGNLLKSLQQTNSKQSKSDHRALEKAIEVQVKSKTKQKSEFHKLRTSEQQQKQNAVTSLDKEELINSFQIKYPGVKILFDGKPINSQSRNSQKSKLQSRISDEPKVNPKTAMLKNVKQSLVERFKTQNVIQNEQLMSNTKRVRNMTRNRVATQVSESRNSTLGKISIENHSLHKFIVAQQQDKDRYLQFPSKQSYQRRMKTNVQKSTRITQNSSKFKIKQRIASLRKQGEGLPKILKQHYQIQAQIFKQFRDKCNQP